MKNFLATISFLSALLLLAIGCNNKPKNADEVVTDQKIQTIEAIESLTAQQGEKALQMYCYSCHNPNSKSHDDMLAPPLEGIKYKYRQLYPDREEFVSKMSDFVFEPRKENAVMKGPVRRFGLMPKTTIKTKEEVYQIVAFIYDNELAVPEWFPAHFEERHGK